MTLVWWQIPSCLLLQSPVPLHLSGETRGRGDGGGLGVLWPPFPEGLVCENPGTGCVCVMWSWPE